MAVYDVTDPMAPEFVVYRNHRDFSGNPAGGTALDLGPEGVLVIPAADGPNGLDLLVVSNEISGSTSIFRIELPAAGIESPTAPDGINAGESGDADRGNGGPGNGDLGRVVCGPNPTTGCATVRFSLQRDCDVELTVHDIRGRQVATLACGTKGPGVHAEEVFLAGQGGEPAGAEIYFVRVRAGRDTAVRKLVLR